MICKSKGAIMDIVQFTEIAMLISFGASWPFNIMKSYRSRTAKGKSVQFEIIVEIGYTIGLIGKFITFHNTGVLAYSVWFYFADIAMVLIDMGLYFRNIRLDKIRDARLEENANNEENAEAQAA
jgi:hypothetical protein